MWTITDFMTNIGDKYNIYIVKNIDDEFVRVVVWQIRFLFTNKRIKLFVNIYFYCTTVSRMISYLFKNLTSIHMNIKICLVDAYKNQRIIIIAIPLYFYSIHHVYYINNENVIETTKNQHSRSHFKFHSRWY